jgi:hypothetical protein
MFVEYMLNSILCTIVMYYRNVSAKPREMGRLYFPVEPSLFLVNPLLRP